jgi:hypothetical protein
MDFEKKLIEIKNIKNNKININIKPIIDNYFNIYNEELKDFTYVDNSDIFFIKKKMYVRYISFNNKINYGGFFVKAEKTSKDVIIYLINKDKKIWSINFNNNFIFINDILSLRKIFENFLEISK